MRREEGTVRFATDSNDILAHQLAVGKLVQGLRSHAGVAGGEPGGHAQQDVGRIQPGQLTTDAALLPDLARNTLDEIGNVGVVGGV